METLTKSAIYVRLKKVLANIRGGDFDWRDVRADHPLSNYFSPQGLRAFAIKLNEEFASDCISITPNEMTPLSTVREVADLLYRKSQETE